MYMTTLKSPNLTKAILLHASVEMEEKERDTNIKNYHQRASLKNFILSKTFILLTFFKIKIDQEAKELDLLWGNDPILASYIKKK